MKRSAGVLLPLFSLPSPYGIGVMGAEAEAFIDRIADLGFTRWQMLPLTPVDQSTDWSPYAGCSAFAGNGMYIDPRDLVRRGLVTPEEEATCRNDGTPWEVRYPFVAERHEALLRVAFSRADGPLLAAVDDFAAAHAWLPDFARFLAARECHDGAPWWEWPAEHRDVARARTDASLDNEARFWEFVQYLFFDRWAALRAHAAARGVALIGDLPMYVGRDSADVWSRPDQFLLNGDGTPKMVAGVPPDYFATDGQLWGNPLYDWEKMRADGYAWWMARLEVAFSLYDIVRIDHFRAFANYWAVPADAATAKEGHWEPGPRTDLFDRVLAVYPREAIIAEDLGAADPDVTHLLADTGLAGIRVMQFAFGGDDSPHLPHNYPANCTAYLGTHDNNTLLGWLFDAAPAERERALAYCRFSGGDWGEGGTHSPSVRAFAETLWSSPAAAVLIALQDMYGFGNDTRTNIPGTTGGYNWRYRTTAAQLDGIDAAFFRTLNARYFR